MRGGEFAILAPQFLHNELDNLTNTLSTQLKALSETGMSDVTPVAHFALVPFHVGDKPQTILMQADRALAMAETEMRFLPARI